MWTDAYFFSLQGINPEAKEKFVPKLKKKGRSSVGNIERRKKQVAHEDQRVSVKCRDFKLGIYPMAKPANAMLIQNSKRLRQNGRMNRVQK